MNTLIDIEMRKMNSVLLIVFCFATTTRASLVDTASSADFYPLPPQEITTQITQLVDDERECKKECLNEGICVLDEHETTSCSCSSGFFGEYCESEQGESCGSSFCRHSSTCFELSLDDDDGPFIEHMCDCTNAYTEDTHYAGEFCQYESTQFCSGPDDPNGRQFCVNGGQCAGDSHLPCICPVGFSGPRCAFQIGKDGGDYAECDLPCQNGGTCQKGSKDTEEKEFLGKFVDDTEISHILTDNSNYRSYEHCVCPVGYFGIGCEYQMEECGEGEHLCFHGSTCVRNEDEFGCDCQSSEIKTAGLFCEYVASSECEQWVDISNGHRGFCTNGGHCGVDEYG